MTGDAGESSTAASALTLVTYGGGICLMLGLYGVIQERIMSQPYGDEFFKVSVFLVLCNRLVAITYAGGMITLMGEECKNKAPLWKYLAVSFSNVAATWCQYEALKYVSFPVQMLGKSFKMMPVMIWGIIISQKKYGANDWCIAGGVTWGVTQFLLTGEIKSKHAEQGSSVYGLLLLLCFLACDGFTSTFQEKLFKEHKTSKYNQMLYVNSGSALVSGGTLLVSGAAPKALAFCAAHFDFVTHAMTLSACAVCGQFCIYSLVKEHGALALAATMNLRQVLSILASYIIYVKPVTALQIMGLAIVFGSLFYKTFTSWKKSKAKEARGAQQASGADSNKIGRPEEAEDLELKGNREPGEMGNGNGNGNGLPAPAE